MAAPELAPLANLLGQTLSPAQDAVKVQLLRYSTRCPIAEGRPAPPKSEKQKISYIAMCPRSAELQPALSQAVLLIS